MITNKLLAKLAAFMLLTTPAFAQQAANSWLQDYEFIKKSLTEGYANLDWIKKDTSIDIAAIDRQTKDGLAKATSLKEAKAIFDRFLAGFNDGHLELIQNTDSSADNETPNFDPAMPGKKLCACLGNENVSTEKFSLPFEKLKTFKWISTKNDPFAMGLFIAENGKQFGVVRMAVFSPDFYRKNCEEMWEKYRKTLTTNCGDACLDNFSRLLANSLLEKLNRQLRILQKRKIESLLVDIGDNGGGTNWVEAIARTIAAKPLIAARFALVKHAKSIEIIEADLKEVNADLDRKDISKKQKEYLLTARKNLEQLLVQIRSACDNATFWTANDNKPSCSMVSSAPFFASGVFPYLKPHEIQTLKSKTVLFSPSQYNYTESIFKGRLIVLVNKNTASAAEYFAALLKDNNAAIILGAKTFGAGGGYVNGGVSYTLPTTKLILKMPNCTRFRADGSNEFSGVQPDIITWDKADDRAKRLDKLLTVLKQL